MRVSPEQTAQNRDALLQAASLLFRKKGIDSTRVKEIAKVAGLTHGALYAHFPSKDKLAAEAFTHGFECLTAQLWGIPGAQPLSFEEYLEGLLSPDMRDRLETGCPLTASCSEIGRRDRAVSASFTLAFETMVAMLEKSLEDTVAPAARRCLGIAAIASEIGAIAVSRAVVKTDMALADEVLQAVRKTLVTARRSEKT